MKYPLVVVYSYLTLRLTNQLVSTVDVLPLIVILKPILIRYFLEPEELPSESFNEEHLMCHNLFTTVSTGSEVSQIRHRQKWSIVSVISAREN